MRICVQCQQNKSVDEFGIDKNNKANGGRKYACKECTNAKRRGKNQIDNRRYHLSSKYGITPEKYDEMYLQQNGLCRVCEQSGEVRSGGKRAKNSIDLFVDHDHIDGTVRGLLCHKCNVAIGLLYDDPILMERAAQYVRGMPCA